MTGLLLTILRCPDSVSVEQRRVQGGEFVLGRGEECDWRLADPERVLSKKHCVLEYFQGGWQVRDTSTNGTFVNHAQQPVGRGQAQALLDGDRLRLGSYEIEVRLAQARAEPQPPARSGAAAPLLPPETESPFGPDLLGPLLGPHAAGQPVAPLFPDDLDLLDEGPAMAERAAPDAAAFAPPPVVPPQARFPDDLDLGLDSGPGPAAPPPVAPAQRPDTGQQPQAVPPHTAEPPVPAPAARVSSAPGAPGLGDLLEGADLAGRVPPRVTADPAAALRTAGALLRVLTAGLRDLLIARADVKREFRIQPTVLHAHMNNPVKFAVSDEQALAELLDPQTPALQAVRGTLNDLVSHQVATLAATQAAARSLLERMDPARIEAEDPGGGLLPGAREKRLWEAFRREHARLVAEFDDDFDSAFGKEFARAYEKAAARDTE